MVRKLAFTEHSLCIKHFDKYFKFRYFSRGSIRLFSRRNWGPERPHNLATIIQIASGLNPGQTNSKVRSFI